MKLIIFFILIINFNNLNAGEMWDFSNLKSNNSKHTALVNTLLESLNQLEENKSLDVTTHLSNIRNNINELKNIDNCIVLKKNFYNVSINHLKKLFETFSNTQFANQEAQEKQKINLNSELEILKQKYLNELKEKCKTFKSETEKLPEKSKQDILKKKTAAVDLNNPFSNDDATINPDFQEFIETTDYNLEIAGKTKHHSNVKVKYEANNLTKAQIEELSENIDTCINNKDMSVTCIEQLLTTINDLSIQSTNNYHKIGTEETLAILKNHKISTENKQRKTEEWIRNVIMPLQTQCQNWLNENKTKEPKDSQSDIKSHWDFSHIKRNAETLEELKSLIDSFCTDSKGLSSHDTINDQIKNIEKLLTYLNITYNNSTECDNHKTDRGLQKYRSFKQRYLALQKELEEFSLDENKVSENKLNSSTDTASDSKYQSFEDDDNSEDKDSASNQNDCLALESKKLSAIENWFNENQPLTPESLPTAKAHLNSLIDSTQNWFNDNQPLTPESLPTAKAHLNSLNTVIVTLSKNLKDSRLKRINNTIETMLKEISDSADSENNTTINNLNTILNTLKNVCQTLAINNLNDQNINKSTFAVEIKKSTVDSNVNMSRQKFPRIDPLPKKNSLTLSEAVVQTEKNISMYVQKLQKMKGESMPIDFRKEQNISILKELQKDLNTLNNSIPINEKNTASEINTAQNNITSIIEQINNMLPLENDETVLQALLTEESSDLLTIATKINKEILTPLKQFCTNYVSCDDSDTNSNQESINPDNHKNKNKLTASDCVPQDSKKLNALAIIAQISNSLEANQLSALKTNGDLKLNINAFIITLLDQLNALQKLIFIVKEDCNQDALEIIKQEISTIQTQCQKSLPTEIKDLENLVHVDLVPTIKNKIIAPLKNLCEQLPSVPASINNQSPVTSQNVVKGIVPEKTNNTDNGSLEIKIFSNVNTKEKQIYEKNPTSIPKDPNSKPNKSTWFKPKIIFGVALFSITVYWFLKNYLFGKNHA